MSLSSRARAVLRRLGPLLPDPLERRLRAAELRHRNRAHERMLAREISAREPGRGPSGGVPVPPPLLRVRVSGHRAERDSWLEAGATDAALIRALCARHGAELEGMEAMLDFGCGCGRVARHWSGLEGPAIDGADTSRTLIRWCRRNLPFMRATRIRSLPPVPYRAGHFDLVYAISVLTHLTEDSGRAWLRELVRVLKPSGLLLFTVHGERFLDALSGPDQRRFRSGTPVFTPAAGVAGSNQFGAYHPPGYVRDRLLPELGLELVEAIYEDQSGGRALTPLTIQDAYLTRRRA